MLIKITTLLPAVVISGFPHKHHIGRFRDFGFDLIAITITLAATMIFIAYLRGIQDNSRQVEFCNLNKR